MCPGPANERAFEEVLRALLIGEAERRERCPADRPATWSLQRRITAS